MRVINVGASGTLGQGAIRGHVGTAGLGCPVERSSTVLARTRIAEPAPQDSRGRLSQVICGDLKITRDARAYIGQLLPGAFRLAHGQGRAVFLRRFCGREERAMQALYRFLRP